MRHITMQEIVDADEAAASEFDNPEKDGLQALAEEDRDALLEYLDETYQESLNVNRWAHSLAVARYAGKYLRSQGLRIRVSNLQIKSAMSLLGYEPMVECVDIRHYKIIRANKQD